MGGRGSSSAGSRGRMTYDQALRTPVTAPFKETQAAYEAVMREKDSANVLKVGNVTDAQGCAWISQGFGPGRPLRAADALPRRRSASLSPAPKKCRARAAPLGPPPGPCGHRSAPRRGLHTWGVFHACARGRRSAPTSGPEPTRTPPAALGGILAQRTPGGPGRVRGPPPTPRTDRTGCRAARVENGSGAG